MLLRRWLTLPLVFAAFSFVSNAQQAAYLDPTLSPAERAHDLVGRMTLDEKASQLEDWATAIPRLGIPDYQTWNEALHGVARAGYSTVFPQAIGMAATWDPADCPQPWAMSSPPRPAPSTTRPSARATTASFMGSPSGRPTSTSSAIPAGDAARRLTAKIRSLPPGLALPLSTAFKAAI